MALHCSRIDYGSTEYAATITLRDRVLRKPLGLEYSQADLTAEHDQIHLVCMCEEKLVGCLILLPVDKAEIRMRQVAVDPAEQGKGVGRTLVLYAEELAKSRGFTKMVLHARDAAVPFYEKLGYARVGEPFEEVTIMHWEMQKLLQ